MKANQSEHLHRRMDFESNRNRLRAHQIETMIAEFERVCIGLGHEIEAEEMRARIHDPEHFAYPTYAKAARERRARLQLSKDALRTELNRLRSEVQKISNWQDVA
jgi:flagellar FliJ protein